MAHLSGRLSNLLTGTFLAFVTDLFAAPSHDVVSLSFADQSVHTTTGTITPTTPTAANKRKAILVSSAGKGSSSAFKSQLVEDGCSPSSSEPLDGANLNAAAFQVESLQGARPTHPDQQEASTLCMQTIKGPGKQESSTETASPGREMQFSHGRAAASSGGTKVASSEDRKHGLQCTCGCDSAPELYHKPERECPWCEARKSHSIDGKSMCSEKSCHVCCTCCCGSSLPNAGRSFGGLR